MPTTATTNSAATAAVAAFQAISDPSSVTTAVIQREVSRLETLQQEKFGALVVRLDAMDRAQMLFHEDLVRFPTSVDKAVGGLKDLVLYTRAERVLAVEEKFRSVGKELLALHELVEQVSQAAKEAVSTALQAAKEAVNAALQAVKEGQMAQTQSSDKAIAKSEQGFTTQIQQLNQLLGEMRTGINDKYDDLKERLLLIEGKTVGMGAQQTTHNVDRSFGVALVAVGLSALTLVAFVVINLTRA